MPQSSSPSPISEIWMEQLDHSTNCEETMGRDGIQMDANQELLPRPLAIDVQKIYSQSPKRNETNKSHYGSTLTNRHWKNYRFHSWWVPWSWIDLSLLSNADIRNDLICVKRTFLKS